MFPDAHRRGELRARARLSERGRAASAGASCRKQAQDLLDRFQIDGAPGPAARRPAAGRPGDDRDRPRPAGPLRGTRRRRVDLILDEPTASLPEDEVELLLAAMRRYAEDGLAIVFVSHRLDEVMAIADTGDRAARRQARDVAPRRGPARARPGRSSSSATRSRSSCATRRSTRAGDVVASMQGRHRRARCATSACRVRAGEIARPRRPARVRAARAAADACSAASRSSRAEIEIEGREAVFRSPSRRHGSRASPSSRRTAPDAAFASMTVRENFSAPSMRRYSHACSSTAGTRRREATAALDRFGVKAAGYETPISLALRRQPAEGGPRPLAAPRRRACCCSTSRPRASTSAPAPTLYAIDPAGPRRAAWP